MLLISLMEYKTLNILGIVKLGLISMLRLCYCILGLWFLFLMSLPKIIHGLIGFGHYYPSVSLLICFIIKYTVMQCLYQPDNMSCLVSFYFGDFGLPITSIERADILDQEKIIDGNIFVKITLGLWWNF